MEKYTLFLVKEKIGMFRPDIYYIHGEYMVKGEKLYKVGWGDTPILRAIGVIREVDLLEALEVGLVELKGKRKISKAEAKSQVVTP